MSVTDAGVAYTHRFDVIHYVVEHDEAGSHHWNLSRTICGRIPGWGYVAHVHGRGTKVAFGTPMEASFLPVNCPACLALDAEARLLNTHFLLCPDCKGAAGLNSGDEEMRSRCPRCEDTGLVLAGHGGRSPIP